MKICMHIKKLNVALVAMMIQAAGASNDVWLEAERFSDKGRWVVDTQYTHLMGSAYLMASGVQEPIGSA